MKLAKYLIFELNFLLIKGDIEIKVHIFHLILLKIVVNNPCQSVYNDLH